jgi:two-component system copper resistance phosphate regulon response regulator CusR
MQQRDGEARFTLTLDDDPQIREAIGRATGLESRWLTNCENLDLEPEKSAPDAVFIDAIMSVTSGQNGALIPRLKDAWPLTPVILTTGAPESDELAEAMALGADDFIMKPIEAADLMKRFHIRKAALVRRAARETIMVADVTIDTLQRTVATGRGQRFLSPTEVKLLTELAKARGSVVPRDQLKTRCWPSTNVSDNALNRKLYEIRRRIKPLSDKINIRTIYGVGFVMEEK